MNLLVIFLHFGLFSTSKCCYAGMHDLTPFVYNTPREMQARLLMEEDIEEFEGQLIQWHQFILDKDQNQIGACSSTNENQTSTKYAALTFAEKQRYFDEISIIFLENDKDGDGFLTKDEFESMPVSYLSNADQESKDHLFDMYLSSGGDKIEINRASSRQIWSMCKLRKGLSGLQTYPLIFMFLFLVTKMYCNRKRSLDK